MHTIYKNELVALYDVLTLSVICCDSISDLLFSMNYISHFQLFLAFKGKYIYIYIYKCHEFLKYNVIPSDIHF